MGWPLRSIHADLLTPDGSASGETVSLALTLDARTRFEGGAKDEALIGRGVRALDRVASSCAEAARRFPWLGFRPPGDVRSRGGGGGAMGPAGSVVGAEGAGAGDWAAVCELCFAGGFETVGAGFFPDFDALAPLVCCCLVAACFEVVGLVF